MCGLFGVVLPHHYPADVPVGLCLQQLGVQAEERGRDAAGIAVLNEQGKWTVAKTVGPFHLLCRDQEHVPPAMSHPAAAIGHTRWATQGGRGLAQASPIAAGPLLCTHNGDLDTSTIPCVAGLALDDAATDSHRLFSAIAAAHHRRCKLTDQLVRVLSGVHGRAALAWTDTTRVDHPVWLARGGLSPLAVGVDQHNGVWWASNPQWLRTMSDSNDTGLQITTTLLPEGSLWAVVPGQHYVSRTLLAEFIPTVRRHDEAIAHLIVWHGFTSTDQAHDQALLGHLTVA